KTKVHEPNTFDGSDPKKLCEFLIQCELNFQDCPCTFHSNRAKVTFAQPYLKGMALAWFKLDLLNPKNYDHLLWMDDYHEFLHKLTTNFGLHDAIADTVQQLENLTMKDGSQITKYIMEFNHWASQVKDYGVSALHHHFYSRLPDHIKDEIACIGKPSTLAQLCKLAQTINACYWEHKAEISHTTNKHQSSSNSNNNKSGGSSNNGQEKTKTGNNNNSGSSPKPVSSKPGNNNNSNSSKAEPSKLGKDGKLTPEERKHCLDGNLCMFCGGSSHFADKCPKKSGK
ncbi:hypothetical protein M404DRAFT_78918, partial [Pisolithus tinctorius Marx 270]